MEKKWIVFQLLKVLEECHSKKVYHGDIKTENVLLTGWDWVLLSDFASFKPTTLPDVSETYMCKTQLGIPPNQRLIKVKLVGVVWRHTLRELVQCIWIRLYMYM